MLADETNAMVFLKKKIVLEKQLSLAPPLPPSVLNHVSLNQVVYFEKFIALESY